MGEDADVEDIKEQHAREAARVTLRKMLDGKKRGDRITAAEVVDATGFRDWRSFGGTIRTWARASGYAIVAVVNDGWRLGLPSEHTDVAEAGRRSAKRKEERVLKVLLDAPIAELTEPDRRKVERLTIRAAARVQQARTDDKEIRKEFKLTERVPLRSLSGGRE